MWNEIWKCQKPLPVQSEPRGARLFFFWGNVQIRNDCDGVLTLFVDGQFSILYRQLVPISVPYQFVSLLKAITVIGYL
jgi:hypothetical protein